MIKKYYTIIFLLIFTILIIWIDFFTKNWAYFFLDTVFFPIDKNSNNIFNTWIYYLIQDIFINLVWYKLFSKIFIFSIIFFSWYLWIIFFHLIYKTFNFDRKYNYLSLFSIIFMLTNPFFYERMITQPWVYLAFLLLWYWLFFLLKNQLKFNFKNYIYSWIFFWISMSVAPHTSFMILLILIIYFLVYYKELFYIFYTWLIALVININWLIWLFLWLNKYLSNSTSFSQENIISFLPNWLNNMWVEVTNILLYWFWGEKYNHFLLPDNIYICFIAWIIILSIIILWLFKTVKLNFKLSIFLFLLFLLSYILWLWKSSVISISITDYLYNYIPFYIWLRDPQKWIWVLLIIYLILYIIGIYTFISYLDKFMKITKSKTKKVLLFFIISTTFYFWSPNVLFSFNNQLLITDFPKEILEFRNNNIWKNETILILPWHSYFACEWTNWKVISNIFEKYFYWMNIIVADNIEIWNLYTNSKNNRSRDIENYISTNNLKIIKKYNIDKILFLDKCADFPNYNFLKNTNIYKKEIDSNFFKVYKIK